MWEVGAIGEWLACAHPSSVGHADGVADDPKGVRLVVLLFLVLFFRQLELLLRVREVSQNLRCHVARHHLLLQRRHLLLQCSRVERLR